MNIQLAMTQKPSTAAPSLNPRRKKLTFSDNPSDTFITGVNYEDQSKNDEAILLVDSYRSIAVVDTAKIFSATDVSALEFTILLSCSA